MKIPIKIFVGLLLSFKGFLKLLFLRGRRDVVFYYPQHFNRSAEGTNPLLDPLVKICAKNQMSYIVLEEPDWGTLAPRNKQAIQFDIYFMLVMVLRKLLPLNWFSHYEMREKKIGMIVNLVSFGFFKSNNYITMGNAMGGGGVFRGMSKDSNIYDYQHGIISRTQAGYFKNMSKPNESIRINNKKIFVYGQGYKDIFEKVKYFENKVFVLGNDDYFVETQNKAEGKAILFSLQFVDHEDKTLNSTMYKKLMGVLKEIEPILIKYGLKLYFKSHPRFNGCMDLTELKMNPQVSFIDESMDDIVDQVFLHITFWSSMVFNFSKYGIPTYILYSEEVKYGKDIIIDELGYPISSNIPLSEHIQKYMNNSDTLSADCRLAREWYEKYHSPIDEKVFIGTLV